MGQVFWKQQKAQLVWAQTPPLQFVFHMRCVVSPYSEKQYLAEGSPLELVRISCFSMSTSSKQENIMDMWLAHFNTSSHVRWKSNILSPIIQSYWWSLFTEFKTQNLSLKCKDHSQDDGEDGTKFVKWKNPLKIFVCERWKVQWHDSASA